ncbi:hypothetical protein C8Q77DRAFT_1115913 [Trametes polyzona]|nr:hypothetical protein C8Q77DRAFT_1115913 [Trametes polyzona]
MWLSFCMLMRPHRFLLCQSLKPVVLAAYVLPRRPHHHVDASDPTRAASSCKRRRYTTVYSLTLHPQRRMRRRTQVRRRRTLHRISSRGRQERQGARRQVPYTTQRERQRSTRAAVRHVFAGVGITSRRALEHTRPLATDPGPTEQRFAFAVLGMIDLLFPQ